MDLNYLKVLAEREEIFDQRIENIFCQECGGRNQQVVVQFEQIQVRSCKGGHTLYFSANGRYLWAVEHHDNHVDWRYAIDHARTEGLTPQQRAWETDRRPRRKGGRKKGGSGWTSYADTEVE
jgi:hypothetical protein